jgi:group I intron endonuclease
VKNKFKRHSNKSGIYKISNLINGRVYIGSCRRFKERSRQHLNSLIKNKHHNKFLQGDFNKHDQENFVFEVVEVVSGTKLERIIREQFYIDQYYDNNILCYNLCKKAALSIEDIKQKENIKIIKSEIMRQRWINDSSYREKMSGENHPFYGKSRSKQVKEKISKANKGNQHTKGRHHTEEAKRKLSIAHKGKTISEKQRKEHSEKLKGRKLSEEHKRKISLGGKGRKASDKQKEAARKANSKFYDVRLMDPDGNVYGPIQNIRAFSKEHDLSSQKMYLVIKGNRNHHKGWKLLNPNHIQN